MSVFKQYRILRVGDHYRVQKRVLGFLWWEYVYRGGIPMQSDDVKGCLSFIRGDNSLIKEFLDIHPTTQHEQNCINAFVNRFRLTLAPNQNYILERRTRSLGDEWVHIESTCYKSKMVDVVKNTYCLFLKSDKAPKEVVGSAEVEAFNEHL